MVRKRVTGVLLRLGLVALGTVFALGIAELALRLFPGLLSEEAELRLLWNEVREREVATLPHPYLGFVYPPHSHREIRHTDVQFTFTTDEHGFRNPSPWPERADIVTVGDSQAFGYGVEDGEAWPRLVEGALPSRHVVNLALIGASPQQYLRAYETFGVELEPRLLLFGLFPGNDVNGTRLFDRWVQAGSPGNFDVWRFFKGRPPDARPGFGELLRRSYLVTVVNEARKTLKTPFSGRTIDFPDGSRLRLAPNVLAAGVRTARPGHPDFERCLEIVEQAHALARENGTTFLVLLFPTKEEVHLPLVGEPSPEAVKPVAEELERRGIPFLDLTPAFQERARLGERLFFEVDGHPNAAGNRIIAATVLEWLEQSRTLDDPSSEP